MKNLRKNKIIETRMKMGNKIKIRITMRVMIIKMIRTMKMRIWIISKSL